MNYYSEPSGIKWKLLITLSIPTALFIVMICIVLFYPEKSTDIKVSFEYPAHWDREYVELESDYAIVESGAIVEDFYTMQTFDAINDSAGLVQKFSSSAKALSAADTEIALLDENEAWSYISNGIWQSYPSGSFASNKSKLQELQRDNTETITVNVWYWSNPTVPEDLTKTTVQKTFAVNSKLADVFKHIFEDIYNDPSQPVINVADKGMGTWVLRGKNHNSANSMSAHALGCAIDINPSTGSFNLNGKWYGNGYKHAKMSYNTWQQLPECHTKYHVLYDGCPIVEIFKSYGFYWGGDWTSTPDCMHLAYIGDGSNARAKGIANYNSRR